MTPGWELVCASSALHATMFETGAGAGRCAALLVCLAIVEEQQNANDANITATRKILEETALFGRKTNTRHKFWLIHCSGGGLEFRIRERLNYKKSEAANRASRKSISRSSLRITSSLISL